MQVVRDAVADVCGSANVIGVSYGSDAATLAAAGIPSVLCGPGDIAYAHRRRRVRAHRGSRAGRRDLRARLEALRRRLMPTTAANGRPNIVPGHHRPAALRHHRRARPPPRRHTRTLIAWSARVSASTSATSPPPPASPPAPASSNGLYPHTSGVLRNGCEWRRSWVEQLAASGYHCVNVGKMHTVPFETPLGFHERYVVENKDRFLDGRYYFDEWDKALAARGLVKQQRELYRQRADYREAMGAFTWGLAGRHAQRQLRGRPGPLVAGHLSPPPGRSSWKSAFPAPIRPTTQPPRRWPPIWTASCPSGWSHRPTWTASPRPSASCASTTPRSTTTP